MKNLKELENFIKSKGWFGGQLKMTIELKSEFEGFYGRASEDWEKQVTIKIESSQPDTIENFTVIGGRFESIDDVAKRVLLKLLSKKD